MSQVNEILNQWQGSDELGRRVQMAVKYRQDAEQGKLSRAELDDLLADLRSLDRITLTSRELDRQVMFRDCIDLLASLPLP